jgi:outer membrane lipoprotein LolB
MSLVCSYCPNRYFHLKNVIQTVLVSRPCIKQTLSALMLTFFLTGCATFPHPTVNLNSTAHQISLNQEDRWLIKGRMGFKSPEKKQSANIRWQQAQQRYQLNMTSIIGTSILKMQGDEQTVTLVTDDETYQDSDPSHLIWRVTGWHIPVEKLRFWIKGQHQKRDKVITSEQGWISQLQPSCNDCQNWIINYDNYKLVDEIWLPHKVVLNDSLNNSQLLIRINQWDLHE